MSGKVSTREKNRVLEMDPMLRLNTYNTWLREGRFTVETMPQWAKDDVNAQAEALIAALRPVLGAFQKMATAVAEWASTFLKSDVYAQMVNMSMAAGEPEDQVETVDIVNGDGDVIGVVPITESPVPASSVIDLTAPLLEPEHDQTFAAQDAVKDPFREPFKVDIDERITRNQLDVSPNVHTLPPFVTRGLLNDGRI